MYYLNTFFICSIFGYIMETSLKMLFFHSMNNGILLGPWIPIYGFGAVVIVGVTDLIFKKSNFKRLVKVILTSLVSVIILTIMEWLAGNLIQIFTGEIFWDYSNLKFNFGHYIALEISLVWFVFIFIFMYIIRPFVIDKLVKKIPSSLSVLVLFLFFVDLIFTVFLT